MKRSSDRAMRMTPLAAGYMVSALLLLAPAARAAEPTAPSQGFTEDMQKDAQLMRQSLSKALGSVETLLRPVPQCDLPRMDENGDIVIRRKRRSAPPADNDERAI